MTSTSSEFGRSRTPSRRRESPWRRDSEDPGSREPAHHCSIGHPRQGPQLCAGISDTHAGRSGIAAFRLKSPKSQDECPGQCERSLLASPQDEDRDRHHHNADAAAVVIAWEGHLVRGRADAPALPTAAEHGGRVPHVGQCPTLRHAQQGTFPCGPRRQP